VICYKHATEINKSPLNMNNDSTFAYVRAKPTLKLSGKSIPDARNFSVDGSLLSVYFSNKRC